MINRNPLAREILLNKIQLFLAVLLIILSLIKSIHLIVEENYYNAFLFFILVLPFIFCALGSYKILASGLKLKRDIEEFRKQK